MKKIITLLFIASLLSLTISCKKKDNKEPEPETPTGPTYVDNIPPAGGDFYFSVNSNGAVVWTKDFTNYTGYSDRFPNAAKCEGYNDTLIITGSTGNIYLGNVYNPSGFKTISFNNSSYSIISTAYFKGKLVVTASNGSNYYYGYCNVKGGSTSVTFNYIGTALGLGKISNLGYALVASHVTSSGSFLSYTKDGQNWSVNGTTFSTDNFCFAIGNTVYRLSGGGGIHQSTDTTTYQSWTQIGLSLNSTNTSDSTGNFIPDRITKAGSKLIAYGFISTPSSNRLAAINVSTDLGNTWSTIRLKAVPAIHTSAEIPTDYFYTLNTKSILFRYFNSLSNYLKYSTTDGVNFTTAALPSGFNNNNAYHSNLGYGVYFK